jgi:hypothetical protein
MKVPTATPPAVTAMVRRRKAFDRLGRHARCDRQRDLLFRTFRHPAAGDIRSEPGQLWNTDADMISLGRAQTPHEAETPLPVRGYGTANALDGSLLVCLLLAREALAAPW